MEEIDSVHEEANQIKSSGKSSSYLPSVAPIAREITVGLEESLIEMKGQICGEPSQLQIIPIVGMGGIGKTTLARYIYQDPSFIHHFDVRAWTIASQNTSAKIILLRVLSFFDPSNKREYEDKDKERLVVHVHRYLMNRRYLIVIDDIWDTNVWDDVRMAFPDNCNGSRIVITTRDFNIATYIDSSKKPFEVQLVSADQSWRLLKERVFGLENCPSKLEKIGKLIAKKCKGLPLAIVVIAGVLSKLKRNIESWEYVARNVSETVNTSSDEQFYDILSLSFTHLPPHLRDCFLYTSCFPEDYEIDVSQLIRLWAAEGLVSDESNDIEEMGYEFLEDLARRSLVLIEKKSYAGKIKVVKIHDVLRDLCIRKSRDENFVCTINKFKGIFPEGIEDSHRLSIFCEVSGCIPSMECTHISTIVYFSRGYWDIEFWDYFKLLKVLDIMTMELESWVIEFSELIHLRYLALAFNSRKYATIVHDSLSKLQNLQFLVLSKIVILPVSIWEMIQIRHIVLLNGFLPNPSTHAYQENLPLTNLHTLSRIENFECSERTSEMLPNLKKLGIYYWVWNPDETGRSKYGLNNLVHFPCLENLSIRVKFNYMSGVGQNPKFPMTLKRLSLSGCVFPWEEMSIIGSLPNLEVLKLRRNISQETTWETVEGEFCELKVLLIDTTNLRQWIMESSHFPKLEHLTLYECNNLMEIPCDIGEIPTLRLIEVDVRNSSVVQSAKGIQEEQQSYGNDLEVSLLKSRSWKLKPYY